MSQIQKRYCGVSPIDKKIKRLGRNWRRKKCYARNGCSPYMPLPYSLAYPRHHMSRPEVYFVLCIAIVIVIMYCVLVPDEQSSGRDALGGSL